MTVINTNVGALMARTYATKANDKMQTSMERLSSGMRINSAADDAAGLAVANKMTSQLSGIKMAIRNSQDGISLVQTAEAGMGEVTNMILRMRELAVQMENGIYTAKDRDNAQLEVNALLAEIDKIATNTRFNDVAVLDGSYDKTIRAGNTNAETIRVAVGSLKALDTAKITEFARETGIADTGLTIGAGADHADVAAVLAASATDDENISTDGADGADADGTDTDIEVLDGERFKIETSVFSTAFKEAFKTDSLGTFTLTSVANSAGGDDATVNDHQLFKVDAKTGTVTTLHTDEGDASTTDLDYTASANAGNAAADLVAAKANFLAFNVVYTDRSSNVHTERINLTVESQLDDIEVETSAKATRAIETLNKALKKFPLPEADD